MQIGIRLIRKEYNGNSRFCYLKIKSDSNLKFHNNNNHYSHTCIKKQSSLSLSLTRNNHTSSKEIFKKHGIQQTDLRNLICTKLFSEELVELKSKRNFNSIQEVTNSGLLVLPNFINEQEESQFISESFEHFSQKAIQQLHWDNVIKNYRETEKTNWKLNGDCPKVLERIKSLFEMNHFAWRPYAHVLDLDESGFIGAHIDNWKNTGSLGMFNLYYFFFKKKRIIRILFVILVVGLSLNSDSVMRFKWDLSGSGDNGSMNDMSQQRHSISKKSESNNSNSKNNNNNNEKEEDDVVAFLPRRSLYIMANTMRYLCSHEIPANGDRSSFKGKLIERKRRVSVILRDWNQNDPVYRAFSSVITKQQQSQK